LSQHHWSQCELILQNQFVGKFSLHATVVPREIIGRIFMGRLECDRMFVSVVDAGSFTKAQPTCTNFIRERISRIAPGNISREGLDNPAVSYGSMAALRNHPVQLILQGCEVDNLAYDLFSVHTRDLVDGLARTRPIIGQREHCADLVQRKSKIPRLPNKVQALKMRILIGAVVALGAGRLRKQPLFLVKTYGLDLGASLTGEMADGQCAVTHCNASFL
jgi:hypothetical protein